MGLRYYAEWRDFGINALHRLEVHSSIAETTKKVDITSFKESTPEIAIIGDEALSGSGVTINLISETRLAYSQGLYAINPFELKILHYIDGVLNFCGWLDTEQYSDQINKRMNYEFSITANNGFAVLDRVNISKDDGGILTGIYSSMSILLAGIKKMQLPYTNIYIGLNTAPSNTAIGATETILDVLYCKGDNYYDEKGEAMSAREALNAVLNPLSAKMYAYKGDIYILDHEELLKTTMSLKKYVISTGAYISTVAVSNRTDLNELINANESAEYEAGANKVAIKFNKYNYESPISVNLENPTVLLTTETHDVTIDDENYKYEEKKYSTHVGFSELHPSTQFILQEEKINTLDTDYFIRYKGVTSSSNSYTPVKIFKYKPGINISSSEHALTISFDFMVELDNKYRIPTEVKAGDLSLLSFFLRVQVGDKVFSGVSWEDAATYPKMCIAYNMNKTIDSFNKWIAIDKTGMYTPTVEVHTSSASLAYAISVKRQLQLTIPFNSDWAQADIDYYEALSDPNAYVTNIYAWIFENRTTAPFLGAGSSSRSIIPADPTKSVSGGELSIELWAMELYDAILPKYDNYSFCIKNIDIKFQKYNEYGVLVDIDTTDDEVVGYLDPNYKNDIEIDIYHGSDEQNNSRGGLLLKTSGAYTDSNYATNLRLVNADTFTRNGITGQLEELLLNTYLSNRQVPRYKLIGADVKQYYPPFRGFTYSLFKRESVNCIMVPISAEVDYVNGDTVYDLLEIVHDSLTIVNV